MKRRPIGTLALLLALAAAGASDAAEPHRVLRISIDKEGRYALDGHPVEAARLLAAIKAANERRPFDVDISAAPQVKYEAIGKAIAVAHEAGVSRVSVATGERPAAAASQAQ